MEYLELNDVQTFVEVLKLKVRVEMYQIVLRSPTGKALKRL